MDRSLALQENSLNIHTFLIPVQERTEGRSIGACEASNPYCCFCSDIFHIFSSTSSSAGNSFSLSIHASDVHNSVSAFHRCPPPLAAEQNLISHTPQLLKLRFFFALSRFQKRIPRRSRAAQFPRRSQLQKKNFFLIKKVIPPLCSRVRRDHRVLYSREFFLSASRSAIDSPLGCHKRPTDRRPQQPCAMCFDG